MYQFILSLKQGTWFESGAPFWSFLILAKIHARTVLDLKSWQAHEAEWSDYGTDAEHSLAAHG